MTTTATPRQSSSYARFGGRFIRRSISQHLLSKRRRNEENRTVYVDNKLLPSDEDVIVSVYPNNTVISSKYTLLTFLPKNLFEQLQRIANFYFLCVACIQFVIDTPVTPLTSILPLAFVISVTAIKQGYEDWLRHKADNEVNLRQTFIIRNGVQETARAMDIKVGDIVKVQQNEEFPCDLILLSSDDPLGQCFITTANLDGETSLKTCYSLNETRQFDTPEKLGSLRASITCMAPVANLYRFRGVVTVGTDAESVSLGPENLLLRGARLKNTEYIYGCAVYTGRDTKMSLNSKSKKIKFSRVERKMNHFLIVFLVVLLLESVVSTGFMYWYEDVYGVPWYVPKNKTKAEALKAVETALAFMVLYNYIIPISLYVTVEVQKFLGSLFFGMDIEMFDATIGERAQANTSDLNEELGQVEYLFTDKTGTLTENNMVFRKCCIGNRQFEIVDGTFCEKMDSDSLDLKSPVIFNDDMDEFFKVLVVCHTVRLDKVRKRQVGQTLQSSSKIEYEYHASSPDEKALVVACNRLGIVYRGTSDGIVEASFHKRIRRFRLLHTLPFDPIRKRMSVIMQDDNGEYMLLCKGAEIAILDRIVNGDVLETQNLINEYAVLGLRTLTIAQRKLSLEEYMMFDRMLTEARRALASRDEQLTEAYNEIEQQLTLLGATAVEDKLQDQVPQTIEALRMAGIKVWVLTGDKEETAVNISHAAGHFTSDMHELRLTCVANEEDCDPQMQELMSQTSVPGQKVDFALIIDGQSLAYVMKSHKDMLHRLCSRCATVLCCRMSPIQKAEVVALIKNSPGRPVTAAIGDGANDVSMIQEADVGLGIMGKEGRQAVRNSDYAFGKFKFLRRALLLHGHLYYNRIAVLVQYFFYKNVAWITAQVFYAFFSSLSQQSLFDPFYLMFYNLTFTSLPILIYGLFEQHIPRDDLLNKPELYRKISRNATLSWGQFLRWNSLGLWHCVVIFFGTYLLQRNGVSMFESGVVIGNFDFGSLIMYSCVITVNLKLLLETYYWCVPTLIAYVITVVGIIVLSAFYTNIYFPSSMVSSKDLYKVLGQIYSTPVTWLAMLLLIITALFPDFILRVIRDTAIARNSRSRASSKASTVGTADREVPLASVSKGLISGRSTTDIQSTIEIFELNSRTCQSSCSTTLTGYDNPVMSLSDENLATSATTNAAFTGLNNSDMAASNRVDSSTVTAIIERPYEDSISPAGPTAYFGVGQPNEDSLKSGSAAERAREHLYDYQNDPVFVNNIQFQDGLLLSVDSNENLTSNYSEQTAAEGYTISENKNVKMNNMCTLSQSDDLNDHESTLPAVTENPTQENSTQPVPVVGHIISDSIVTFSPSPSHTIPAHHNQATPCQPVSESDVHPIVLESFLL
ncbi:hypothetical protein BsWGS_03529 [Bradybaena similaris]